jgi:hypothetical protein
MGIMFIVRLGVKNAPRLLQPGGSCVSDARLLQQLPSGQASYWPDFFLLRQPRRQQILTTRTSRREFLLSSSAFRFKSGGTLT